MKNLTNLIFSIKAGDFIAQQDVRQNLSTFERNFTQNVMKFGLYKLSVFICLQTKIQCYLKVSIKYVMFTIDEMCAMNRTKRKLVFNFITTNIELF